MKLRSLVPCALAAGALVSFATSASASDGVLEINQVCATATGCFPGDGPGFPVQVSQPNNYRLTSNLTPPAGADAILSNKDIPGRSFDLDLNGFSILGPGTCTVPVSGSPTCAGQAGTGVLSLVDGIRVRNGTIAGFLRCVWTQGGSNESQLADLKLLDCGNGIALDGPGASIERVEVSRASGHCISVSSSSSYVVITSTQVRYCLGAGIVSNGEARVVASVVDWTGLEGVFGGDSSVLSGITVRSAGKLGSATTAGIRCGRACLVSDSATRNGGGAGIMTGRSGSISGNRVELNSWTPVDAGDASTIHGNTIDATNVAGGGFFEGIVCGSGCNVFDNVVHQSSTPVSLSTNSRYSRNVFTVFTVPPVGGVSAGDNLCNGTSC